MLSIAGPGGGEDVEVRVPLAPCPMQRGDLVEVLALEPRVLRARLQPHAVPVAAVDEAPVAVALVAQPLAHARVAQPLARLLPAVRQHPRRQDPGHLAEAVAERRRVGEDVEALDLARRLHRVDRALPGAGRGAGAVADVEVRDLAAACRPRG